MYFNWIICFENITSKNIQQKFSWSEMKYIICKSNIYVDISKQIMKKIIALNIYKNELRKYSNWNSKNAWYTTNMTRFNEQENFWSGNFWVKYIKRNSYPSMLKSNIFFFKNCTSTLNKKKKLFSNWIRSKYWFKFNCTKKSFKIE